MQAIPWAPKEFGHPRQLNRTFTQDSPCKLTELHTRRIFAVWQWQAALVAGYQLFTL
jgi:hypothetical protein